MTVTTDREDAGVAGDNGNSVGRALEQEAACAVAEANDNVDSVGEVGADSIRNQQVDLRVAGEQERSGCNDRRAAMDLERNAKEALRQR